jgi:hypothetical protein
MKKRHEAALLFLIVIMAAMLRLNAVDWDDYNHYHPDERYIAWVGTSIEWPKDWSTAFDPHASTFNPFYWPLGAETDGIVLEQDTPRRFAYGHVPLYLGVAATRLVERVGPSIGRLLPDDWLLTKDLLVAAELNEFEHIAAIGRVLAALFDLATIVMLYLLGRWLYGPAAGLVAAAFLALSVMHIQLAHFFASDPFLTFFVVSTLAFLVLGLRGGMSKKVRTAALLAASISLGLAVGSKFSAILLLLPLTLALFLDQTRALKNRIIFLILLVFVALLVFSITNPFAILDWTCELATTEVYIGPVEFLVPETSSCYTENVVLQATMVRGTRDVPFARQYEGTTPYLYFIEMQLKWGMGFIAGAAVFLGFIWAIWRGARICFELWRSKGKRLTQTRLTEILDHSSEYRLGRFEVSRGELVVLSWSVPFFITTGALMVKFMRYLQPLTPFLYLYAALLILTLPWKRLRWIIAALILAASLVRAVSFVNMYAEPHPWRFASEWIFNNVETGSTILNEVWDDQLPDSVNVKDENRHRSEYNAQEVNWLTGADGFDNSTKLEENLELVAEADYLVLSSNRNYGVIPRLDKRYALSSQYYHLLFSGELGFEVAFVYTRMPNLFGLYLRPDTFVWPGLEKNPEVEAFFDDYRTINLGRFDESFTVYDQPLVIIFKNIDGLSADEMGALFEYSESLEEPAAG